MIPKQLGISEYNSKFTFEGNCAIKMNKLGVPFWFAYCQLFGVDGRTAVKRDIELARKSLACFKFQAH